MSLAVVSGALVAVTVALVLIGVDPGLVLLFGCVSSETSPPLALKVRQIATFPEPVSLAKIPPNLVA